MRLGLRLLFLLAVGGAIAGQVEAGLAVSAIVAQNSNLRSGPGAHDPLIPTTPARAMLEIVKLQRRWSLVSMEALGGYLASSPLVSSLPRVARSSVRVRLLRDPSYPRVYRRDPTYNPLRGPDDFLSRPKLRGSLPIGRGWIPVP